MATRVKKPRLGRGLSSLMSVPVEIAPPSPADSNPPPNTPSTSPASDASEAVAASVGDDPTIGAGIHYLRVDQIRPNPAQPRQHFDEAALDRLGQSIQRDGLMQPVVVRQTTGTSADGLPMYELVAGERRWRAAKRVNLAQLPAVVHELTDQQMAEWALIENLQREDLNPIERAHAFRGLIDQFGLSHDDVADRVGVQRPTVSNHLRLLELHDDIIAAVREGRLSMGHARALLGLADDTAQQQLARKVMAGGWSVRQTEQAVRALLDAGPGEPTQRRTATARSTHLVDLERQIASQLQTKVHIKSGRRKGAGTLAITFYSLDQFDELLERLGVKIE